MVDWKSKIDEIDANKIDLVLGNFGDLPKFTYNGKEYTFRWPDQRVKAALVKEYLADWAKTIEEMPEGKVKRELIKQMGKEVRSIGVAQLIEYFGSGDRAIVNYLFHCMQGENKLSKDEILNLLLDDAKDEKTGQGFLEFASLHVARALVVYVQGKGREAALEFLRNFKKTTANDYVDVESTQEDI